MRAAELAVRKIGLTWNHRALPQIESIASMERAAGPLGLPFLGSFGFIALPGLAGLLWAVRGSTAERWLAGYALLMTLALIPFFITDRYRHHLVPALAVLSGIAVRAGWHVIRSGRRDARLRAAIAAACASVVVFFPIAARDERLGSWAAEADASIRLAEAGRDAEAVAAFERAEQALHRARLEELSTSARTAVASFHLHYGIALASLGREDDAITHWEEAARISPNDATSLARLQIAYRRSGRSVDEARVTRELDAVPGGRGLVLLNEGWWAAGRGDLAGAEQAFLEASRVSTDLTMAWEGLIRVLIQEGRFDDADRALAAARDAGLDGFPANVYASYLAARRGDIATAQRTIARIPVRLPQADPTLRRLLEDARRLVSSTPTRPARGGS